MNPVGRVPSFHALCLLVKERNAFDYAEFCEIANAPAKQQSTQLYCRVMSRLRESDNQAAQLTGKAMETFWNNPNRDKVINEYWTISSANKPTITDNTKARRLVTRSASRAVAHVAYLNDKLLATYSDSVLKEAGNQLTSLTASDDDETPVDTTARTYQGSHFKTEVGSSKEQVVNVTDAAEDGFNGDVDAHGGVDAHSDSDTDDEDNALVETSLHSPFSDLIKDLYRHYGHDLEKMTLLTKPVSSPLVKELYAHAKHLLDNWRDDDPIRQKHLLVALSCVVNTIDGENAAFYEKFTDFNKLCVVEGFMTPSTRQLAFVQRILGETNFILSPDLDILDVWVLRHACDIRVSLKRQSPFYPIPNINALMEELTICSVVHILCNEMIHSSSRSCSEQEDVCLWRDVARALYHGDVIPRMGELASQAVRSDRRRVEGAIKRDRTSVPVRGRKIDLFFQLEEKPVELFCWEAKTADAATGQLQIQRCKNVRLNACLIGTTLSLGGLDRRQPTYPLPSPLLLDIAGRAALPYKILKVEPDVFVAGAVMEDKGMICLPRSKEDIVDFLNDGGMSALLNIKHINDDYVATIKEAMRKVKREETKNKMLGYESLDEGRNPIINTPIKRYKVGTQRTPTSKNSRLKSPNKVK